MRDLFIENIGSGSQVIKKSVIMTLQCTCSYGLYHSEKLSDEYV